jgi:hypothetical protein
MPLDRERSTQKAEEMNVLACFYEHFGAAHSPYPRTKMVEVALAPLGIHDVSVKSESFAEFVKASAV